MKLSFKKGSEDMFRELLKAKIHRLTVTDANPEYEGSITIDEQLLKAADIVEYEKVQVADVTNGSRFETYVIKGQPDSGTVCVNGAAAKLVSPGDIVIVMSYVLVEESKIATFRPKIVLVDAQNKQIRK
jgi:aspartate 1-decarboxylase